MREHHRSRTEIAAQILEAAIGGTTKTKIMYKTYVSYEQLKEYLPALLQNRLLVYDEGTYLYKTTGKGLKLLMIINRLSEYLIKPEQQTPARAVIA
jgi:predicted transcriptional regulator